MDHFGAFLEYELLPPATDDALASARMAIQQKHLSGVGVAHGGAIYALVDYAFGASLWRAYLDSTQALATINLDIHYLRPVTLGTVLTVQPVIVHRGRSILRVEGKVHDEQGRAVAYAAGAFNVYRRHSRLERALKLLDELHSEDPAQEDGLPAELLYAQRMRAWLERLVPEPSEELLIAVSAQHTCRWRIRRADYPEGRAGYKQWRKDEARMHADLAEGVLKQTHYDAEAIERVRSLVLKQRLKSNPEAQTLEDVACLVFLEHYFAPFAAKHDDDKIVDIVRKTWAKMSDAGHAAALGLELPPRLAGLVQRALDA